MEITWLALYFDHFLVLLVCFWFGVIHRYTHFLALGFGWTVFLCV